MGSKGLANSDIKIELDFRKDENQFYFDHSVDGRYVLPCFGYIDIVWMAFARFKTVPQNQLPIIFEDMHFLHMTTFTKQQNLEFNLRLSFLTGDFELYHADQLKFTGRIREPEDKDRFLPMQNRVKEIIGGDFQMKNEAIYKELKVRGYDFGQQFQTVLSVDCDNCLAKAKSNNLVTYLDSLFHPILIRIRTHDLYLSTSIKTLQCDPRLIDTSAEYFMIGNVRANYIATIGAEMYGMGSTKIVRKQPDLALQRYVWMSYFDSNVLNEDMRQLIKTYIQLLDDMIQKVSIKTEKFNHLKSLLSLNQLDDNCLVLKDLIENSNSKFIDEHSKSELAIMDWQLSSDLLNNLYFTETLLRPAVEIILENTLNSSNEVLNILEINSNEDICFEHIIDCIDRTHFGQLNVKYWFNSPIERDLVDRTDKKSYKMINIDVSMERITDYLLLHFALIREQISLESKTIGRINEELLRSVYQKLAPNGFLLIFRREVLTDSEKIILTRFGYTITDDIDSLALIQLADRIGFSLVSKRSDNIMSSVLLFRKVDNCFRDEDIVIHINHSEYDSWFEKLKDLMKNSVKDQRIWLISDENVMTGIIGFVNCLRKEWGGHRIRCISDLNFGEQTSKADEKYLLRQLIENFIKDNDLVMNIYRNGKIGSYRSLDYHPEQLYKSRIKHAKLIPVKVNNETVFQWIESKHNLINEMSRNVLVNVFYAGFGPLDHCRRGSDFNLKPKKADKRVCSEFSGLSQNGNRVFGIKYKASLATTLVFESNQYLMKVPEEWSLEESCSIPVAYGTAYYALVVRAQIESGYSVLIDSADGYLGRAAIAIALSKHCQVYTTVCSEELKSRLLSDFHNKKDLFMINTSVDNLEEIVFNRTYGYGLDVVFDYSNEFSIDSGFKCLKENGRYILMGEKLLTGSVNAKNFVVEKINFENLFANSGEEFNNNSVEKNIQIRNRVLKMIENGITEGVVKPIKTRVFDSDQASHALQYLTSTGGKQKVLVRIRTDDVMNRCDLFVNAVHKTKFNKNKSYIITGGLGGFGLQLSYWMVERGARNLVLTSRSGINSDYQKYILNTLILFGAQVIVKNSEGYSNEDCEVIIKEAKRMAPVAGIFCLAMVIKDRYFKNQTTETMEMVFKPKVHAIKNLDRISRDLCPDLEYFVGFSSIVASRGNAGQSNYGYANSFIERICEARRAVGLPGLAFQWGAIGDVGVAEELFGNNFPVNGIAGTQTQRINSCLSVMNHFLRQTDPVVTSAMKVVKKNNQAN